jgi:hypothetical protein
MLEWQPGPGALDPEKYNAAQAEYNRLAAALDVTGAPQIPPACFCLHDQRQGSMKSRCYP